MFALYLLCGCIITNTILWSFYASWFQGPNIHILFFLISLSLIYLLSFLIDMPPGIFHKISYHVICGAPIYIKVLLTDTVSYEKETNVDLLVTITTL